MCETLLLQKGSRTALPDFTHSLMIVPNHTTETEKDQSLFSSQKEKRKEKIQHMKICNSDTNTDFRVIPGLFWQLASRFLLHPLNLRVNKSGSKSNQS